MVHNTPYSLGYVELIYALQNHMAYGAVKNAAGQYIQASTNSVSAAAAATANAMPDDFRVSLTNAPGAGAYPIASLTWLLIPEVSPDPAKGKILKDFLAWMLQHGESEAAASSYAPLPSAVATKVAGAIQMLK